jgi:arylsulfatase A-like enzyme
VDDSVGRILAYLDESGLAENTLVIYSSDQGFYLGEHGWFDKRWMYEESLRMPFLARWPARIPPGTRVPEMIQNIDYAPTFLEAAGLPVPQEIQGESLVPLLERRQPGDWRRSIYYHYYEFPAVHMVAKHYGVRTERYKLIHYYETGEWECFDLEADPHELRSVYGDPDYADVVADLRQELTRLQALYGDTDPEAMD